MTARPIAIGVTALALCAGSVHAATTQSEAMRLTPAEWSAFAAGVTGFLRDVITFDKAQRRCLLIGGLAARPCRARADRGLARAYAGFRSRVDPVVAGWPRLCHALGAEVVDSLTRYYNDKRGVTSALNRGDNKAFAHLEGDGLLAEGAGLKEFTSMSGCRG